MALTVGKYIDTHTYMYHVTHYITGGVCTTV